MVGMYTYVVILQFDQGGPMVCTEADTLEIVTVGLINSGEGVCDGTLDYKIEYVSLLSDSSYNQYLPKY